MKRLLTLVFTIAVVVIGFLSVRGALPFIPILGTSMEPQIRAGDIITVGEVAPSQIKVGDVIVFNVPPLVQQAYNYPALVAHRVIKIDASGKGIFFRTKGDNVEGEDPFTVRAQDLRGIVSNKIAYVGFPLLFMQSKQGLIFIIVALALLAVFFFTEELGRGRRSLQRGIFSPVIEENQRTSRVLEQRIQKTETEVVGSQQALEKFAGAIAEYAQHLKSHTSAIQGLSEASHELKNGAAEQNKVLARMLQVMETATPPAKVPEEITTPEVEQKKFPPGCARSRLTWSK